MYEQLDPHDPPRRLARARQRACCARAAATATLIGARPSGGPRALGAGEYEVPVAPARACSARWCCPTGCGSSSHEGSLGVAWSRSLAFPGLRAGEQLTRTTNLPRRASLLAGDGSVLAESPAGAGGEEAEARCLAAGQRGHGAARKRGPGARRTAGRTGGAWACRRRARSGSAGSSWRSTSACVGRPAGSCWPGARVLASAAPRPAPALRTSISPTLQKATVAALGAQYGGIVAMRPSGQILAVAGIGLDGLQPPGSTFKMVTLSGVLAAHLASPHTVFPYATFATLDGVKLSNANGEECGGTLGTAFAVSCNSVFSPLGVKLGAERLVASAERLGFNSPTRHPGRPESTLPSASEIHGELDVGSTAIGQGSVLATPLQMATVAATVADGGQRPQPTFLARGPTAGPLRGAVGLGGENRAAADDRRGARAAPAPPRRSRA